MKTIFKSNINLIQKVLNFVTIQWNNLQASPISSEYPFKSAPSVSSHSLYKLSSRLIFIFLSYIGTWCWEVWGRSRVEPRATPPPGSALPVGTYKQLFHNCITRPGMYGASSYCAIYTLFPTWPCTCPISMDWIHVTPTQLCVADRRDSVHLRKFYEFDSIVPLTYFCIKIDNWQNANLLTTKFCMIRASITKIGRGGNKNQFFQQQVLLYSKHVFDKRILGMRSFLNGYKNTYLDFSKGSFTVYRLLKSGSRSRGKKMKKI
jgi:hypothetical protein